MALARCIPSTGREISPPRRRGRVAAIAFFITFLLVVTGTAARGQALDAPVRYSARDSIRYDLHQQIVYLFGGARVEYQGVALTADRIEYRFGQEEARAHGAPDSSGAVAGKPVFDQGGHRIEADSIRYNFRTQKGLIKEVRTSEQETFVQARVSKRHGNGEVHSKGGLLTTCDRPRPHYHFRASRMMVIPDDKIVTGPAVMKVGPVPTPIAIPFGFFPNKRGGTSGVLMPTYGESATLGFFLLNGGYYRLLGEHADLSVTGDIYSRGSWALRASTRYRTRYRYSGALQVDHSTQRTGSPEYPDFSRQRNFFVKWNHTVDPRASLSDRFTASVHLGTSNNFRNNFNSSTLDYLSNTFQSNIGWTHLWPGKPFTLAVNLRHAQNTGTRSFNLTVPALTFNMSRILPFQRRVATGRWYEQIGVTYALAFDNQLSTTEERLYWANLPTLMRELRNGVRHGATLGSAFKTRFLTINPEFTVTERWYFDRLRQEYHSEGDTVLTHEVPGFARNGDWLAATTLTSKLYGMYQFNGGWLKAVRHVLTPSVRLSYRPDLDPTEEVYAPDGSLASTYNPFQNGIYGSSPSGESGQVGLGLVQSLEAKVRNAKADEADQQVFRKVKLLDFVGLNSSYDWIRDSLNWSPVNLSARTTLLNRLNVNFVSIWDPYAVNELGQRIDRAEVDRSGALARLTAMNVALGFDLKSKRYGQAPAAPGEQHVVGESDPNKGAAIDFNMPWRLSVNYSYDLNPSYVEGIEDQERQSVLFNGDVTLFKYWKLGVSSGYDVVAGEWTPTSLNLYWDLHCWEFNVNWIPNGYRQSISLQLNVKASVLRDLRYQWTRPIGNDNLLR